MQRLEKIFKAATVRAAKRDYKEFKTIKAHEFSTDFQEKMQGVIKQAKKVIKRPKKIKIILIAAAIFLLNVTVILANESLREKMSRIFKVATVENTPIPEVSIPPTMEVTPTIEIGETVPSFSAVYKTADSYDEVVSTIENSAKEMLSNKDRLFLRSASKDPLREVIEDVGMIAEEAMPWSNPQVDKTDGGDIVKTDGEYIYTVCEKDMISAVLITKVEGNSTQEIATIEANSQGWGERIQELYVSEERLYVITVGTEEADIAELDVNKGAHLRNITYLYTYDLANPQEPKLIGKVSHSGDYDGMRRSGEYIYFFSGYGISQEEFASKARNEENAFAKAVPLSGEKLIPPEDIYLPTNSNSKGYIIVSSVNVNDPSMITETKAIMGDNFHIYATQKNIYIQLPNWSEESPDTNVVKFGFYNGKIMGESAASVPGLITEWEAINEYENTLRVLSTAWGEANINQVTIFDDKLELIGKGEEVIAGETISKVRFIDNIGYFMTYEKGNPMYILDLTNPAAPKEMGRVENLTFPNYLSAYEQGKVVGLTTQYDSETWEYGESYISMLDVSDPTNIQEISRVSIDEEIAKGELHSYLGPVSFLEGEDTRGIVIDPDKKMIGFEINIAIDGPPSYNDYMIFTYEEANGLKNLATKEITIETEISEGEDEMWTTKWYALGTRGVYIEKKLYIISASGTYVFDGKDKLELTGKLPQ